MINFKNINDMIVIIAWLYSIATLVLGIMAVRDKEVIAGAGMIAISALIVILVIFSGV